ncbi:MAG TPA: RNase adapter RapZ [Candidatus Binataceae bacterium]|nr:RNase adapter RapZ [Candidatus Binataceae bacterium]
MAQDQTYTRLLIVTGVAGSGRATAMRVLEDLGFYCVDNLPIALAPNVMEMALARDPGLKGIALGVDARERLFFPEWPRIFAELERRRHRPEVIFLDASDEVLMRRYSETRRPHPMAEGGLTVPQAIRRERQALAELRERADRVIETSALSVHELREMITAAVLGSRRGGPMAIELVSFGYKYGMPIGLDIVQDVRFIPNPFFVEELRPLTGLDPKVREWVLAQPAAQQFVQQFESLLRTLLPMYDREGRSYLSLGLGCTGGRHRSPVMAEEIRARLAKAGYQATARHQHIAM